MWKKLNFGRSFLSAAWKVPNHPQFMCSVFCTCCKNLFFCHGISLFYIHFDTYFFIFFPFPGISHQIFRKGGLTGSEFLEEGCRKRRVTFFSNGEELQFLHKKETKIWNFKWQKKFINKKMFIYTKNLNWRILGKNLVTFKR